MKYDSQYISRHPLSAQKFNGFTLVELMLVLVVISILVAMTMPSYQAVTNKGQRVEGKTLLLEVQGQMERYYFNNQIYPDRLSKLKLYTSDIIDSENTYYQVSLDNANQACLPDRCYLIVAKHHSGQTKEELWLHSNGAKEGPW